MVALLDVNVLIALLDADHTSHSRAREWFKGQARHGWATCPITQNGCVRIMSHPGYPNALPVSAVIERLGLAIESEQHTFWADDHSVLDGATVDRSRIHGTRQITDIYLLAMAVRRGGCFVTFDAAIPLSAARGAQKRHLAVL